MKRRFVYHVDATEPTIDGLQIKERKWAGAYLQAKVGYILYKSPVHHQADI